MRYLRLMSRRNGGEWHYRNKLNDLNHSVRERKLDGQAAMAEASRMAAQWQACETLTEFKLVWED